MELSSAAFATAGLLPDANASQAVPDPGNRVDAAKADSSLMTGKIALEEHLFLPDTSELDNSLGYTLFSSELPAN